MVIRGQKSIVNFDNIKELYVEDTYTKDDGQTFILKADNIVLGIFQDEEETKKTLQEIIDAIFDDKKIYFV